MLVTQVYLFYQLAQLEVDFVDLYVAVGEGVFAVLLDQHQNTHQSVEILVFKQFLSAREG